MKGQRSEKPLFQFNFHSGDWEEKLVPGIQGSSWWFGLLLVVTVDRTEEDLAVLEDMSVNEGGGHPAQDQKKQHLILTESSCSMINSVDAEILQMHIYR